MLRLLGVCVALLIGVSATFTTAVHAVSYTYDVSSIACTDGPELAAVGAGPLSGPLGQSASASVQHGVTSTTLSLSLVATNTASHAPAPPDGSTMSTNKVLDATAAFLGAGYTEPIAGSGRCVSADGTRVVRLGDSDITGRHGGGSHANFETLECDPRTGRMRVVSNHHVYLT